MKEYKINDCYVNQEKKIREEELKKIVLQYLKHQLEKEVIASSVQKDT